MTQTPANLRGVLGTIDLRTCEAAPDTLTSAICLAIEIAREGREGRRIGTIFTVGAEDAVLQRSRCLILDPLAGHPLQLLHLGDPNLRETIKELAQLDGGFVVTGSGHVLSACRYFESTLPETTQPLGLGTRHLAAASISASTGALAVVVSESSVVRIFSTGQLMTEILPELWLLSQYMPHIAHPTYTSDQEQNLAILSEPSLDRPTTKLADR
jgi:DNA integrity scanning protein DisA with diadenylate cyclase activity